MVDAYNELVQPEYLDILKRTYGSTESVNRQRLYGYIKRRFKVSKYLDHDSVTISKQDYVLVCWLKQNNMNKLIPFYVSKAYDELRGFRVHRYVFPEEEETTENENEVGYASTNRYCYRDIILAEGPARDHRIPSFNIELHYLELRKHYHPSEYVNVMNLYYSRITLTFFSSFADEDRTRDPVCKLNSGNFEDNAELRLCSIVLNSTYFKNIVKYVKRTLSKVYYRNIIAFRTDEGLEEAAANSYFKEIMLCCEVITVTGKAKQFYISRAYNPNQVFVYSFSPDSSGRMRLHLENLSIDVSIVQEPYNFGNVEI